MNFLLAEGVNKYILKQVQITYHPFPAGSIGMHILCPSVTSSGFGAAVGRNAIKSFPYEEIKIHHAMQALTGYDIAVTFY